MSVSNGQKGDETTFNNAFMSRTTDTNTTGQVDLENVDAASGASVFNAQKSLNGAHSAIGTNANGAQNQVPSFATDNTGSPGDNMTQRIDAVQAKAEANEAAIPATTDDLTEGATNLYYTEARVSANSDVVANTAKVSADGSINTHSDVDTATVAPSDGDFLIWNNTDSEWQPSFGPSRLYRIYGGGTIDFTAGSSYTNQNSLFVGNDEIRVAYNATYHNQTNNISVFMWIKSAETNDSFFFSQYDFGNGNQKWFVGQRAGSASGEVEFVVHDGTNLKQYRGTTNINDNTWHHVGLTFTTNSMRVYVDGTELTGGSLNKVLDQTVNSLNASVADIMIGSLLNNNTFSSQYGDLIDEITYWDKELTPAEVSELYNSGQTFDLTTHSANANLISWYKIDGDSIPTITDVVNAQNATDLTVGPAASIQTDVVAGESVTSELSFTDSFFVEVPGLSYTDNTIPITESPITLANNEVAYVVPNLATGGGNLSVTVDTLANVPSNGLVLARRLSDVVRVEGLRLADGQNGQI